MRVLAITHGPSVGPGVFEDAVQAAGHELVEHQLPTAGALDNRGADAIVVLGGAMHPDEEERHGWLRPELRYLERQLEHGTPMLGVCLGSQLIARAAGARVFRSDEPEVGWLPVEVTAAASDPVASALPPRFDAFQWHHYTHDLPAGAVELARSDVCLQAYRLGRAWGVQFHPEVREEQVESWLAEDPDDVADPAGLRAETRERIAGWNELGRRLCTAFLAAV